MSNRMTDEKGKKWKQWKARPLLGLADHAVATFELCCCSTDYKMNNERDVLSLKLLTDEVDSAASLAAYLAISLCSSSSRFELSSILLRKNEETVRQGKRLMYSYHH